MTCSAIGAAVDGLARTFDRYWNSELAGTGTSSGARAPRAAARSQVPSTRTGAEKAESAGANFTDSCMPVNLWPPSFRRLAARVGHAEVGATVRKERVAEGVQWQSDVLNRFANAIGEIQSETDAGHTLSGSDTPLS